MPDLHGECWAAVCFLRCNGATVSLEGLNVCLVQELEFERKTVLLNKERNSSEISWLLTHQLRVDWETHTSEGSGHHHDIISRT